MHITWIHNLWSQIYGWICCYLKIHLFITQIELADILKLAIPFQIFASSPSGHNLSPSVCCHTGHQCRRSLLLLKPCKILPV